MVKCSVPYCKGKGIFRFPKNEFRRNQWERAVNVNFHSSASSRLCPIHFEKDDFVQERESFWTGLPSSRRVLKNNAVPSKRMSLKNESEERIRKIQKRLFEVDCPSSCSSRPYTPKVVEKVTNECFPHGEAIPEISVINPSSEVFNNRSMRGDYAQILDSPDMQIPRMIPHSELSPNNPSECKSYSRSESEDTINLGANEKDIKTKVASVQIDINRNDMAMKSVGIQTNFGYFTVSMFLDDNRGIRFYTGLESYAKFMLVFQTLSPYIDELRFKGVGVVCVSPEDMLLLTLMKLRRNKPDYELSRFFAISETLVSNIFHTWISFMHQLWSLLDTWPSRELVDFYMPKSFKKLYPSTRVIVDATEIPIVKPTNPIAQQATFSTYKNRNTIKVLVGASPGGLLSYCSAAYGGSASDRQIVERSDLIKKCQRGDSIMADRGFNVQDICAPQGVAVNIPHFLKGKQQLPGMTVLSDRKLSSKRVHIERLIGLTKTFRILQAPLIPPYTQLATKIYSVCLMLCNFRDGIVSKEA